MITNIKSHLPEFLVNSLQLYVVVTDLEGKYLYTNNTFKTVFNFLSNDLIGEDFAASVWHEDIQLCIDSSVYCIENPDESKLLKIRKPKNDEGQFFWTSWEFSAFKINSEVKGILCVGFDSTKEVELTNMLRYESNRLKNFIESSNQISILMDLNFIVLDFNTLAGEEVKTHMNEPLQRGLDMRGFIVDNYKEGFRLDFQKAKLGLESKRKIEIHYDSGKNIWYQISLYPIVNEQNEVVQILLRSQDVTEQVFAEQEIALQRKRINEIVWYHSHVVRSPLSNILGLVNLMLENKNNLSEEEIDYILKSIGKESKRLDETIREKVKNARSK